MVVPEAPFIQLQAGPTEPNFLMSVRPTVACLFEGDHFLDHVTPDPGGVLPSEGVQKVTPNKKRLKWDPLQMVNRNLEIVLHGSKKWILDRGPCFEANCTRIWAKRVQKRGPQKADTFGECVFGHLWMVNRHLDLR